MEHFPQNLCELDLSENLVVSDELFAQKFSSLQTLILNDCKGLAAQDGAARISPPVLLVSLKRLSMADNFGLDLEFLRDATMPDLNYLNLSNCNLVTNHVKLLFDASQTNLRSLEYLVLRNNDITTLFQYSKDTSSTIKFIDVRGNR